MVIATVKHQAKYNGYQTQLKSTVLAPLKCNLLCDFKLLHIYHGLVIVKRKTGVTASFRAELTKPREAVAATANQ